MKGRDDDGELYFATTTHRMQEVSVLLPAHIHRILDALGKLLSSTLCQPQSSAVAFGCSMSSTLCPRPCWRTHECLACP